jgi:hypothetical protein
MAYTAWQKPDPQSVAGLNSVLVYGENLQVAVGINHQVALGSNLALCINPLVLFDLLGVPGSSTLSGFWGSGPGGNMQFTIGSSANVVWGRQFSVNLGPEAISVDANQHSVVTGIMCGLVGAAVLAYVIAYGITSDENDRATEAIIFQGAIDLLLGALMTQQMFYKSTDQTMTDTLRKLFIVPEDDHSQALEGFVSALSFTALMGAMVAPAVAMALDEGHFQGETQDAQFGLGSGGGGGSSQ